MNIAEQIGKQLFWGFLYQGEPRGNHWGTQILDTNQSVLSKNHFEVWRAMGLWSGWQQQRMSGLSQHRWEPWCSCSYQATRWQSMLCWWRINDQFSTNTLLCIFLFTLPVWLYHLFFPMEKWQEQIIVTQFSHIFPYIFHLYDLDSPMFSGKKNLVCLVCLGISVLCSADLRHVAASVASHHLIFELL